MDFRLLWIIFASCCLLRISLANPRPCQRPNNCDNPCRRIRCEANPLATCRPYYCNGRCEERFYIDNYRVQCTPATPIPPAGYTYRFACPPQKADEPITCAQMCLECERQNLICCSNGCGNVCKTPIIIAVTNTPTPSPTPFPRIPVCPDVVPGTFGICVEECFNCTGQNQLCCSNGCGHVCKDPVFVDITPSPTPVTTTPKPTSKCPPLAPGIRVSCVEMSETECRNIGKIRCFNGCGHTCMDPVLN